MALELKSSAFTPGAMIPQLYTCEGEDLSLPLSWNGFPANTVSFALVCDDPDAPMGIWVHWVVYNIPKETKGLSEGMPLAATLTDGTKQGFNDFQKTGYGGPCPPPGKSHRYVFRLYALNVILNIKGKVTRDVLLKAMEGHILDQTALIGTYKR